MTSEETTRDIPTPDGYDLWAPSYDGEHNPMVEIDETVLPDLLGDLGGLDVLDLGCGTGRYVKRALAAGARVTGVDASAGMLAEARSAVGDSAELRQHDLDAPLPFAAAAFDLVVSSLVLEHIEDPGMFFREAARVVRPGGRIVVSTMHPAMFLRGLQAHYDDDEEGVTYRFESFDHQVGDFVSAGLEAGLQLEAIREERVDEAFVGGRPRAEKYLGWPMLLALALRRPA